MTDPVNRETVREFISNISAQAKAALGGMGKPGYLQMSLLHPTSEKLVSSRYKLDDDDHMIEDAVVAAQAGHNVYIEGRTIREDAARDNGRGKLKDTAAVFALVIDTDADKQMGWEPNASASPSMSVETSPGNFQYWYFFRDAVAADIGQHLGERIRKAVNCDHDTGNVVQPYRVAGTANYPNKKKRERGRITVPTQLVRLGKPPDVEEAQDRCLAARARLDEPGQPLRELIAGGWRTQRRLDLRTGVEGHCRADHRQQIIDLAKAHAAKKY